MKASFNKVIAILKYLEVSLKRPDRDFNSRFMIQKIAFLSKALGISLYHNFSIYVNGPYSHVLAIDYYEDPKAVENHISDAELTVNEQRLLDKIKEKILDHPITEEYEAEFIEAVSTIIYFKLNNPELSNDDIFVKVKQTKPHLKEWMIIIANNVSKQLLFREEYMTDEIKRENEMWDNID
ncbi:MAG: hypothetical protein ACFFAH_14765 [Promethearchaeota archaeon]